MKTEKVYTEIMNQLEIIHKENLAIIGLILELNGAEKSDIDELLNKWHKLYQDERMRYD